MGAPQHPAVSDAGDLERPGLAAVGDGLSRLRSSTRTSVHLHSISSRQTSHLPAHISRVIVYHGHPLPSSPRPRTISQCPPLSTTASPSVLDRVRLQLTRGSQIPRQYNYPSINDYTTTHERHDPLDRPIPSPRAPQDLPTVRIVSKSHSILVCTTSTHRYALSSVDAPLSFEHAQADAFDGRRCCGPELPSYRGGWTDRAVEEDENQLWFEVSTPSSLFLLARLLIPPSSGLDSTGFHAKCPYHLTAISLRFVLAPRNRYAQFASARPWMVVVP
ncbi:hypothetical protein C8Q76DRAFT_794565 [Earliella scabrosa]|nr:hypothetical protein C8Q76DRAFT_794565 [Earliella scabrosa]